MAIRVTTIGDGAMATVCSQLLAGKGFEVRVWGRDGARLRAWNAARENSRYLPGVKLAAALQFEGDANRAMEGADFVLCAVPTQFIRGVLGGLKSAIPNRVPVISVAKGIEISTLKRPTEVVVEVLGERAVAVLSGPCIAGEMARKLPTTMVAAARRGDEPLARKVQELFGTGYLRVYRNNDLLGVELAGAMKNVVAIAAGILDGMRAGNNAKAALLTRGLVEITRLGVELGAKAETFAGLAGMGDLVTTCFSPEGRNRTFGERIGIGENPGGILGTMTGVVEGMPTCRSVVELAREKGIEMPICESLYGVLFEGKELRGQLAELMARDQKHELEG